MQQVNRDPSLSSNEERGSKERPTKRRKHGHAMQALLAREIGLMRESGGSTSASFVGSASGIHFIRSVYGAVGTPTTHTSSPHTTLVPGEDDRLISSETVSGSQKLLWHNHEAEGTPTASGFVFDELVEWSASFFDNWHPAFPLLHAPSILFSLESIAEADGDGLSQKLQTWEGTIVRAIISISLADRRETNQQTTRPIPRCLLFNTFENAVESIQTALTRPATLLALQAVLSVQLFLVSMLRLNAASRLSGLLTQMAYQLGLHRCPMRYRSFSSQDRQLRKRIFWSMYCIERYLCQALGHPLTLRDDDVDVCHLNKELHPPHTQNSVSAADVSTSEKVQETSDDRLQLLRFLAEHAQLRGSIIELRNKRVQERDQSPDAAILINARLTQWWNEVEDFLDQLESDSISPISLLHAKMLQSLRHESTIMLYRPLLALPKDNANYTGAIHSCIGAAKSLLNTLVSLLDASTSQGHQGQKAPMIWPSFTWSSWMSAFVILYAAAEGKVGSTVVDRYVDKALMVLRRLGSRGSVWPDACAMAVEDLRSVLYQRSASSEEYINRPASIQSTTPTAMNDQSASRGGAEPLPARPVGATPAHHKFPTDRGGDLRHDRSLQDPSRLQRQDRRANDISFYGARNDEGLASRHIALHDSDVRSDRMTGLGAQDYNLSTSQQHLSNDFHEGPWLDTHLLPQDMLPMAFEGTDPFQGFDIPFWLGQDNYVAWMEQSN